MPPAQPASRNKYCVPRLASFFLTRTAQPFHADKASQNTYAINDTYLACNKDSRISTSLHPFLIAPLTWVPSSIHFPNAVNITRFNRLLVLSSRPGRVQIVPQADSYETLASNSIGVTGNSDEKGMMRIDDTYSGKLLQGPEEITLPFLQSILDVILAHNPLPHLQALDIERNMFRRVHVILLQAYFPLPSQLVAVSNQSLKPTPIQRDKISEHLFR